jgi:hypothetical protein
MRDAPECPADLDHLPNRADFLIGNGHTRVGTSSWSAHSASPSNWCGPYNEITYATGDREITEFWADHRDCEWDC